MTDIRRTLLWVVFTMSLVLLWDGWNKHTGQPSIFGPTGARPAASAPPFTATPSTAASQVGIPAPVATAAAPGTPAASAPAGAVPTTANAAQGELVVISTDVVKASFDSNGGNLVRLELLRHADVEDRKRNVLVFEQSAERSYAAQSGLVAAQAGVALPNHYTPMKRVPGANSLADGANELQVRFESVGDNGVKLAKTYSFKRGDYRIGVRHEAQNTGAAPVAAQLYLQLARDGNPPRGESSFYFTFTGPAIYTEAKKFEKVDFKDIEKGKIGHATSANDGWVAMVQHYFASAWLVPEASPREFRTAKVSNNLYSVAMVLPLGEIAAGATKSHDATLFAGPQEENKLAEMAPGLDLVKDYGVFTVMAKPLFWLLDQLNKVLKNWGWSIVALVVLLKIAFYWLNASAYRSMAKMKAVGPRVTDLRERYKDKPQLMQQEMMRIYREEKVNPLGGCLPILVQMPFFIALYWVLLSSVEMRNAPWIGWITDLSAKDPFFVLPVLMTASSLFQVWLNPTPADPMQAKMMWMMPLIFGVMFFFFPAGLVLYWLTNNILSITQQWFINRQLGVNK
jgi:YidC/Oxa1 family membrane protein insertase